MQDIQGVIIQSVPQRDSYGSQVLYINEYNQDKISNDNQIVKVTCRAVDSLHTEHLYSHQSTSLYCHMGGTGGGWCSLEEAGKLEYARER